MSGQVPDEFQIIDRYFKRPGTRSDVLLGVGDDGAVLQVPPGSEVVVATDALVQGVHFPESLPPHALGHRCLAVNLSDLAAMGATPAWATLALCIPEADSDWLGQFARGFFELADAFDVSLVGGDTVRGRLTVTVTVLGLAQPGRAVTRAGAAPGDSIWITGEPGIAALGLRFLDTGNKEHPDVHQAAVDRFLYPLPRVHEGLALVEIASAMIDVSDGLDADLGHLLKASGLGASLTLDDLVLSDALAAEAPDVRNALVLNGGDDYELCFTVAPDQERQLERASGAWTCPVQRLGRVEEEPGLRWFSGGRRLDVPRRGYRHFGDQCDD